jgi:hypothetical protein
MLESVESGQRTAIEAVRKFIDTVDDALPRHGEGPNRRHEIVDSAMEMADRLVHTQYDFIRRPKSRTISSATRTATPLSSDGRKGSCHSTKRFRGLQREPELPQTPRRANAPALTARPMRNCRRGNQDDGLPHGR